MSTPATPPRIGVLVVAYNAAGTLHKVLDRIPEDFRDTVDDILVSDDASTDATYLVGMGYKSTEPGMPITILRQAENLGYGGNQKVGYRWAIDHGLDVIVLLHGDGQYAPELLPEMVAPLVRGECDAVFGSRMMHPGNARRGGMPLYKYVGNKVLSRFENFVMGTSLSEWHSGYRAYSVAALREIPFERNSDDFDFDTQIIVQLFEAGKRIHEIPIPTFYGDEISHVNGIRYGLQISRYVVRYRLQKLGFGRGELVFATGVPDTGLDPGSAQELVLRTLSSRSPRKVLDLACGDGRLDERLRAAGHTVTAVRDGADPEVAKRTDRLVEADLDDGLPALLDEDYDVVVAEGVFERVRRPEELLGALADHVDANASLLVTIPNVGHWYARLRFGTGRFDYDQRGLLDRGHLRFFTRRSFTRMAEEAGYRVVRTRAVGFPFGITRRGVVDDPTRTGRWPVLRVVDRAARALFPDLFAYQWVIELQPR